MMMKRPGRVATLALGLVAGAAVVLFAEARGAGTDVPGASGVIAQAVSDPFSKSADEKPRQGRYQIAVTSSTMGTGLPWYGVWVIDTVTGSVKWIDHPDVAGREGRYNQPFQDLTDQPSRKMRAP